MSDLAKMSLVKADDMDAINESGAANLLRMNVAENKALRDALNERDATLKIIRNHREALK